MPRPKKPDSWANTKPNIKCATIAKGKVKCYDIRPEINSRTSKPPKYSVNKIEERNKITEEKKKQIEKESAELKKKNPKAYQNPYTHIPKGMKKSKPKESNVSKPQKLNRTITLKEEEEEKKEEKPKNVVISDKSPVKKSKTLSEQDKKKKKQAQTIVSNRKQRRLKSLKKQLDSNKITKEKYDSEVERVTKEAKEDLEKIKKQFS